MDKGLSGDIAKVVRGILAERQMTVKEFAAVMGQPNSSVSRWINQGGSFKTDVLDDIAEALDMDTLDLVQLALAKRRSDASAGLSDAIDRVRPKRGQGSQGSHLPERKRDSG